MSTRWPLVSLAEVLTQDGHYIDRPEPRAYPKLSVKLYGKGVVLDRPADGASLRMQRHQLAKAGQVILSEIWGKKGAIGIVPPAGDGALCTSHFFLFDVRRDRIEPRYLQAIFSSNYLEPQLGTVARGTTGYAAVRPRHLLEASIPLPPLPEQRRIVARLNEIETRIRATKRLRVEADVEVQKLPALLARRPDLEVSEKLRRGWSEVTLSEVLEQRRESHRVEAHRTYPNLGIYSFARGLFAKPPIDGARTSARDLYKVKAGQFIYSRLFAFEGAFGMVTEEFDGWFVSNEYPVFDCDVERVLPEFLAAYFSSPNVWALMAAGSKGLGDRRQRVRPEKLIAHRLLVPPLADQIRLRRVAGSVTATRAGREAQKRELEAILSATIRQAIHEPVTARPSGPH